MPDPAGKHSLEALRVRVAVAKSSLDEWGAKFLKDPVCALEWSNQAFIQAARFEIFTTIIDALDALPDNPENSFEKIVAYVRRDALRGARSPASSTSMPYNLMDTCRTQAWADALALLEGRI
jgi:hypothetical protein